MEAAAHTPGGYGGVPQSVGKEFVKADDAPIAPHAGPNGRAAGIMFLTLDERTLLLKRGNGGDFPLTWAPPAGHLEPGETPEQAARRETREETGFNYEGPLTLLHDDGQFALFVARGVPEFPVTLCDESLGFVWCDPANAGDQPMPLHPGVADSFRIALAHTELDVARLIRDGLLPSPQKFVNSMLFAVRITGTGQAYRSKLGEFVHRDESLVMNEEYLARCNGLPVVWLHPEKNLLDSKSFAESVVGTILLPYLKGSETDGEAWGIARIIDMVAADKMAAPGEVWSTSPGVTFNDRSQNIKLALDNGSAVLVEGNPNLIDHLAICELGVWDKEGPPEGVQVDQPIEVQMTEEEKAKLAAEEKAKADAARADSQTPSLGDIMKAVTGLVGTVGGLAARMDSMEKDLPAKMLQGATDARKDSEEEKKARADAEEKEKAEAKAKADAAEKERMDAEEKAKADAAKADMASEEEYADCQSRADAVFQQFGKSAPRPLQGEGLMAYRRRLLRTMQPHSKAWEKADLATIGDSTAFGIAETAIYADAQVAASSIGGDAGGGLRAIKRRNDAGHTVTTFAGRAGAWMDDFRAPVRALVSINKEGTKQ